MPAEPVAVDTRRTSIAVTPLAPGSLAGSLERLGSVFLEDLIDELARSPILEVLAARTSFSLPPDELAPSRLAARFGVTHVLDVAVRPTDDGMLVKAGLIEAETGRLLFTQDERVTTHDLANASGAIAARVANQLRSRLDGARLTRARARPVAGLEAYDLWLRGWDLIRQGADQEARALFERAIELQPSFGRAYVGLSLSHFNNWSGEHWIRGAESERLAYEYARKAQELDDRDHYPHMALARMEVYRRNFGRARRHLERVQTLSPNNAEALALTSLWWAYLGEHDRGVAQLEKAMRLNPLHESWYFNYGIFVYFAARRLADVIRCAESVTSHGLIDECAVIAAAHAHAGDLPEARRNWEAYLDTYRQKIAGGGVFDARAPVDYALRINPFARAEDRDYLAEGMRIAGGGEARREKPPPPPGGPEAGAFIRRGALWEARFDGRTVQIPDAKGCRDLAVLLAAPGVRVHCMELAERVVEGDAGQAMDARARAAYQRRILDLQAELAEAEDHNDFARTERIAAELDALIEQLSAAVGLGERGRKLGDPAEKARTAVTWRLRNAIRKIAEAHPALGRHLGASIRTGSFCVYDPEQPVRWTIS